MYKENKKRNYNFFDLPYLVKGKMLYNTGQFPKFKDDVYKIENHDLYLIPTSEVTLINLYSNEIINESLLPIKISSYSPCFPFTRFPLSLPWLEPQAFSSVCC